MYIILVRYFSRKLINILLVKSKLDIRTFVYWIDFHYWIMNQLSHCVYFQNIHRGPNEDTSVAQLWGARDLPPPPPAEVCAPRVPPPNQNVQVLTFPPP